MNGHPDWLAVGQRVDSVRRLGRSVAWRRTLTVARHTKILVVLDNGDRYARRGNDYHLIPRYLDYTTTLEPVAEVTS